ncbi:MAG: hypothetical protein MZV63_22545 [Marinilabiliales bacterium]|nr:hypothetical protein [Marinilabiliales bacterium]
MLSKPITSRNTFLCRRLLERNIASGRGLTADDRVLLSQAMMRLAGSDQEYENALSVVRTVISTMEEPPAEAFKQEALSAAQPEEGGRQKQRFTKYESALGREEQKYASMAGDWSQMLSYLASEKEWVTSTRRR